MKYSYYYNKYLHIVAVFTIFFFLFAACVCIIFASLYEDIFVLPILSYVFALLFLITFVVGILSIIYIKNIDKKILHNDNTKFTNGDFGEKCLLTDDELANSELDDELEVGSGIKLDDELEIAEYLLETDNELRKSKLHHKGLSYEQDLCLLQEGNLNSSDGCDADECNAIHAYCINNLKEIYENIHKRCISDIDEKKRIIKVKKSLCDFQGFFIVNNDFKDAFSVFSSYFCCLTIATINLKIKSIDDEKIIFMIFKDIFQMLKFRNSYLNDVKYNDIFIFLDAVNCNKDEQLLDSNLSIEYIIENNLSIIDIIPYISSDKIYLISEASKNATIPEDAINDQYLDEFIYLSLEKRYMQIFCNMMNNIHHRPHDNISYISFKTFFECDLRLLRSNNIGLAKTSNIEPLLEMLGYYSDFIKEYKNSSKCCQSDLRNIGKIGMLLCHELRLIMYAKIYHLFIKIGKDNDVITDIKFLNKHTNVCVTVEIVHEGISEKWNNCRDLITYIICIYFLLNHVGWIANGESFFKLYTQNKECILEKIKMHSDITQEEPSTVQKCCNFINKIDRIYEFSKDFCNIQHAFTSPETSSSTNMVDLVDDFGSNCYR